MATYVALLRGINVSGQKKIKMAELSSVFESMNFSNVGTYIQSGNVIFDTEESHLAHLTAKIENKIKEHFSFEVTVILRDKSEIKKILANNPFLTDDKKNPEGFYMTFLSGLPPAETIKKMEKVSSSPEEFIIDGKTIYLFFPDGYGRAKMNNNFFEKKLMMTATTRNWKTVKKLYDMMINS